MAFLSRLERDTLVHGNTRNATERSGRPTYEMYGVAAMRKRASGVSIFAHARGSVTQASWSDVELIYLMLTGWKVGKDDFPVNIDAIPPITTITASTVGLEMGTLAAGTGREHQRHPTQRTDVPTIICIIDQRVDDVRDKSGVVLDEI